ncbi:PAS domain S-box protein [Azospirillum sp.]|uniref:PAS domain S-box protein n=1 Tax=Azospirillum sp. TaxID=34012 RepID=UPI002D581D54|nr:PAS domain S-box protein [Azospirillum sp.]HYD67464.1 PAS domain S-box protein [Azospirillum sp.]
MNWLVSESVDLLMTLGRSVGLLAVVSVAYIHLIRRLPPGAAVRHGAMGLLFGAAAVTSMADPIVLAPGINMDARSVLLALAGPFGDWAAAVVAGAMAMLFRLWQGGVGAIAGIASITATTLAGIAFALLAARLGWRMQARALLGLGAVIGPINLAGVFLLPTPELIGRVLAEGAPSLVAIGVLGTLFLGTLLEHERERLEAQRALGESERRFRMVFDNVRDVVFKTDRQGNWQLLNPAWEEVTGFPAAEALGACFLDYVHPDDREKAAAFLDALTAGWLQHGRHAIRFRSRGGGWRWTEMSARPLLPGDGGLPTGISGTLKDITARREAEAALRESRRRFQEITSVLTEGVYVVDLDDRVEYVNPAAERMLGWRQDELKGRNAHATFHHSRPDGAPYPADDCAVVQALRGGKPCTTHVDHLLRKDGAWLPVALAAAPIVRDGVVCGAVAAFHEITERLRQEQVLRESEERYRLLFNSSMDAIMVNRLLPDGGPGRFVEVNDVACERLGYTRDELLSRAPPDIDDPESAKDEPRVVAALRDTGHAVFERVHVARDGRRIPVEIAARRFLHAGQPAVVALVRDITERKRAEERIYHLAHYDALTDLPNRRLLMDRLDRALALAARHGRMVAVLMLDLDGFKPVNDRYGHEVGDELLTVIARRLETAVRRADTLARLGGDEFVVVLSEVKTVADAELVAGKVIAAINEPVAMRVGTIHVGASVGIGLYPADGSDAASVMRAADRAMYRAKADGRNQYALPALV